MNAQYETQAEFADVLGMAPAYLSHLLTGHRNIGEKKAREIEIKLRLPRLALDIDEAIQQGQLDDVEGTIEAAFHRIDLSELLNASEATQEMIKNLQIGLREKRLTEADIELLNAITRRLMSGKSKPVATNPQHAKLLREAEKNNPDQ